MMAGSFRKGPAWLSRTLCLCASVPLCLLAAVTLPPSGMASAAEPADNGRVVDQFSPWRSHLILRPPCTSPRLWKTIDLTGTSQRYLDWDKAGRDWSKFPGGDHRFAWSSFSHHGDGSPATVIATTPQPAAGWEGPDFDDSAWPRERFPLLMQMVPADQEEGWNRFLPHVGGGCFRATFQVPDPEKVKELTLAVTYRGGLAAWVNGQEVGRGHLPAGPIGAEAVPDDYPEDAYVLPPNEARPDEKARKDKLSVGEIGGPYRPRAYDAWNAVWWPNWMTREEHELIVKKRDRVLGPVTIPGKLLRKGTNVLAIRLVRADFNPVINFGKGRTGPNTHYGWIGSWMDTPCWWHGVILDLSLRADPPGSAVAALPAAGARVWTEDVHKRCTNRETADPAAPVLRMLGARSGQYSAQLLIGAAGELRGLAAEPGALKGPGGAEIPASAVQVRYCVPRSVLDLGPLGVDRGPSFVRADAMRCSDSWMAVWRYAPRGPDGKLPFRRYLPEIEPDGKEPSQEARTKNGQLRAAAIDELKFFDDLAPAQPAAVPAGSSQSVWVTVKVPADAAPGLYAGTVTVKAEGLPATAVPVRLQVFDWKLPDPAKKEKFGTFLAMEQSPWGVAKAHKVQPWSDEHFARIEDSLRFMGEMGNDFLMIPVLTDSEFGNREDSFVVWAKGKDGKLSCDFSRLERYLDIAQKYTPRPRAVCFVVVHPAENNLWVAPRVLLRDEASGKTAPMLVPGGDISPFAKNYDQSALDQHKAALKELWAPFVAGVLDRMKARGLEKSVYWGYEWDYGVSVDRVKDLFAELAPGVSWARGAHNPGVRGGKFGGQLYGCQGLIIAFEKPVRRDPKAGWVLNSYKGWKSDKFWFSIPRAMSGVLNVEGRAAPFAWRAYPELALVGGAIGVGRVGLDYWNWTYQDGWRGGGQVGMSIYASAWPGDKTVHSSARLEMLREGLQEAEARILLEKKLESAPDPVVQKLLDDRIMATLHMPRLSYVSRAYEYHGGWQERSWDLYAAAAAAGGGKAPPAEERARFFGAGGK
jgi:hypothetical protein